jgi:hypothetical protein
MESCEFVGTENSGKSSMLDITDVSMSWSLLFDWSSSMCEVEKGNEKLSVIEMTNVLSLCCSLVSVLILSEPDSILSLS